MVNWKFQYHSFFAFFNFDFNAVFIFNDYNRASLACINREIISGEEVVHARFGVISTLAESDSL